MFVIPLACVFYKVSHISHILSDQCEVLIQSCTHSFLLTEAFLFNKWRSLALQLSLQLSYVADLYARCAAAFLPHGDIEDVGADRAGHGHVSETFPGHDDAGDEIRDGGSGRQDGEPHDLLCDADGLADLRGVRTGSANSSLLVS